MDSVNELIGGGLKLFGLGFGIVLIGVVLTNAGGVNTIFQGYTSALGQLEKA